MTVESSTEHYRIRVQVWIHRTDGQTAPALLTHDRARIRLEVADVGALRGLCADPAWRSCSQSLARRGQRLDIAHDGMHLLSLGAVGSTDQTVTGSRFIEVGSWPGACSILGLSSASERA